MKRNFKNYFYIKLINKKYIYSYLYLIGTTEKVLLPDTSPETVRSVITPSVTLAGTQSISIQNETQEIATIKMEGK